MAHTAVTATIWGKVNPSRTLSSACHVGRYFVLSHVFLSSLTSTYPLSGVGVAASGASGSGRALSMSIPGSTTAFITSSTTP